MGLMSGGKGGGKNALAAKPNLLNALRVQTSSYGQVIPIVYGQNRVSGRLLWSGDFAAIPHTSTQKVGGKGLGSGGGNAITNTTYTYQSAVATALCLGPIQNIHNVWDTKGRLTLLTTSAQFTVPVGGGSFLPPPDGRIFHSGRGVSRQDAFSFLVNDYGSDGSSTFSGNQQTPMALVGNSPGAGQYMLDTTSGQHTFSAADANKVMTITYVYSVPDSNSNGQPQQKLSLTLFTGTRPQTPWSYLTSRHPGQDLGYGGVAYVASSAMDLGESGTLPNLSFEVLGILPFNAGITDCNPKDIIADLLSNPFYGLGTGFYRIQSSGGSTPWKYYLDFGLDTAGIQYQASITVSNVGSVPVKVDNNHGGTATIQPGATQNVSLPFTGSGANNLQLLFETVNAVSDPINVLVRDPALFKISDGINLATPSQRTFAGWNIGTGATVTVNPEPQVPMGDLTQYSNYCVANGIFLSPVLDAQKSAADWIQEILDVTNSAAVWSEGVLKIVPYGDTTAVGNGATFLPSTSPVYDLSSNDFLSPITVKRPSIADVMNSVSVEFLNRSNDYNVEIAEDKDDAMIAVYGLRKASPKQAHSITTAAVAKQVANFLRKREVEIRATYTITLGWQFNLLEPMDLVTLTVPELGYTKKPVRITAIRENDNGQLEIDAEDFPFGTASPTLYPQQGPGGFVPQANADPGNVNTPIVFEAPFLMSKSGQHEIWMAVSGGNWGNLLLYSEQFDNAAFWGVGNATVTANAATDPNGGVTADAVTYSLAGTGALIFQTVNPPVPVANQTFTFSCWVKTPSGTNSANLLIEDQGGAVIVNTTFPITSSWQRFQVTGTMGPSATRVVVFVYNLATAGTLHLWGAQLENSSSMTSYTQTTSTPVRVANPNWGGCSVWISQDNSEYHQIGRIYSPARMGFCGGTGTFGITGDPYTGGVGQTWDLLESGGVLHSGTQADADSYRTLVYFDGEFMSYANITLVSANVYNPAGYIRRGLFGTTITAHNVGSSFARLDDAIFTYVYDPAFIGKTIYLKFTSFNTTGLMEQSIANATAYQFIVTGKFCQMETVSKNLLANPGFERNQCLSPLNTLIAAGQRISDNWVVGVPNFLGIPANTGSFLYTGIPRSGTVSVTCRFYPALVLANNSYTNCSVASDPVAVTPGEAYSWGGYINVTNNGVTLPANVQLFADIRLAVYAADGSFLDQIYPTANGGVGNGSYVVTGAGVGAVGYKLWSAYAKIPAILAGKTPAFIRLCPIGQIGNFSGSNFSPAGMIDANFDDLFLFPQWSPAGDEIGKQGSMSNTYTGSLTYTSTTSSITWSWNLTASRTDSAMSVNSYSGSQTITGLAAGTSYNFYPFIDEINQVVTMVATGGTGSPSWAHSGTAVAWTQEQARGDHFPLSSAPVVASTTTSGSGGGSGGGIGGSCLRDDVLVREKKKGVIKVRDLVAGDWVRCPQDQDTPDGWAEVSEVVKNGVSREWVHTSFNIDDWLATTPGHPFTLEDGSMKRAAQLCLEDAVPCTRGIAYPVNHALEKYCSHKVSVTVRSARHVFYAGMKSPCILQHNLQPFS